MTSASLDHATTGPATNLTDEEIEQLRAQAAREAGPFVDPQRLHRIQGWWRYELYEWATAIVGRPISNLRTLTWREMVLLDLAREKEPTPPPPPALTAQRAASEAREEERERVNQARKKAERDEWDRLRAAMPVPVSVAFNYSRHTYEFHQNGGDHIVVWGDIHVGRLHRKAGRALCHTPARAKSLHLFNAELERKRQDDGSEHKAPTCKKCITTATRITETSKEQQ